MFLNRLFDMLTFGTSPNARYAFIVGISIVSAMLFLLIFKKTSNQQKITYHKNKIFGHVLQIPLYKDRFGLLLISIVKILKHNLLYIKQTLIPLLFMIVPLVILMVQIDNRCGYEPLQANQQFFIRAEVEKDAAADTLDKVLCETSGGIQLETPPLRIEAERGVFWRARVVTDASEQESILYLRVQGDGVKNEKQVVTDYSQKRFLPDKKKWSFWNALFTNAEGYLAPDAPFSSISINYQRAGYWFLFWDVDAIILYFILTLIFAFALKGVLGVNI